MFKMINLFKKIGNKQHQKVGYIRNRRSDNTIYPTHPSSSNQWVIGANNDKPGYQARTIEDEVNERKFKDKRAKSKRCIIKAQKVK